ncbi:hypothetical protein [Peribacillus deserti]|uniref:Uncharacterized protein n=1 Tax=Peribacillus deserti TaxID=673318 RepID=A0A2N5LZQ3_9BACI|nr:hypothetical protein [Peribacillus deserti]PLT27545.1 hypothetical protein CUU66_23305 [Peribacillus deserti]
MLKQTALKVALSGVLLTGIVSSPFSLNTERIISYASQEQSQYAKPLDKLVFISSTELGEKIKHIKGGKKDETLDKLKDKVKKNALEVKSVKKSGRLDKKNKDLVESTDIAANVDDVRKDADLQAYLQTALDEGKKVYLYGETSLEEYKQLLNIDKIKVKAKDLQGYIEFGASAEDVKAEKGEFKENAPVADAVSNIIGFSKNGKEKRQFVDISIAAYDDEGNSIENKEDFYIQNIMAEQAEMVELDEAEYPEETALITSNKANAASSMVKEAYGAYSLAVSGSGTTMGRVDMDWELLLANRSTDNSSTYDYFTLSPLTQANAYNGAQARAIWQDLDIPIDGDELKNWTPQGDSAKSSWDLTIGFPWAFSATMGFGDAVTVDDQSSTGYDYARWNVTDGELDDEVFKGTAGWASTGTYATASYAAAVTVQIYSGTQYKTAAKRLSVNYDYS